MAYQIVRTAKADEQLRDIVLYRAEVAGSVEAALEFLDRLEQKISRLADFPESGSLPRYGALRARGYRVLIAEKHLVFYKVDEERRMVMVYAIVDGRRAVTATIGMGLATLRLTLPKAWNSSCKRYADAGTETLYNKHRKGTAGRRSVPHIM